jgi:tRNA(Ser,Leu) C12 N-acetylase TAN1
MIRTRNNTSLNKDEVLGVIVNLIKNSPPSVPSESKEESAALTHSVNLDNPQLVVIVEIFKSACGLSVVQDYYQLSKYNVQQQQKKFKE